MTGPFYWMRNSHTLSYPLFSKLLIALERNVTKTGGQLFSKHKAFRLLVRKIKKIIGFLSHSYTFELEATGIISSYIRSSIIVRLNKIAYILYGAAFSIKQKI